MLRLKYAQSRGNLGVKSSMSKTAKVSPRVVKKSDVSPKRSSSKGNLSRSSSYKNQYGLNKRLARSNSGGTMLGLMGNNSDSGEQEMSGEEEEEAERDS